MNREQLLKFPITTGNYGQFINHIISSAQKKKSINVCVANVHMFVEANRNKAFASIIGNSDIVTPDGQPLVWGLRLLQGIKQERIAGMDLLPDLLQACMDNDLSVYFYGGSQDMLDKTQTFLKRLYPTLQIAGLYSPPFRPLNDSEEKDVIEKINIASPALVFVVLGCPKQEQWMASMRGRINSVMVGIGGALPVLIGLQKRAPKWMQSYGLEWLFRLLQEPRRLFKRYFVTNTLFIIIILKASISLKLLLPLKLHKSSYP